MSFQLEIFFLQQKVIYIHVILSAVRIGLVVAQSCAIDISQIFPIYSVCDSTYTLALAWIRHNPTCDAVQLVASDYQHREFTLVDEQKCEYAIYVF